MPNGLSGFTIVELIVVTIVLSILVAGTVVAYGGIKNRSANTHTLASVAQYEKGLKLYYVTNKKPLQVNATDAATYNFNGYPGEVAMFGTCIGDTWPSRQEAANKMGATPGSYLQGLVDSNNDAVYTHFCGVWGNGNYTQEMISNSYKTVIAEPAAKGLFPPMPSIDPIYVDSKRPDGSHYDITLRGVRYAWNGSSTQPISYLYYPLYGKVCPSPDMPIRLQDTVGVGIGPYGVFPGWSTYSPGSLNGDFTFNNTVYCVRTIDY